MVVLFPFLVFMAILIKLESPGPVFFTQDRVGARGRSYMVFEFRSIVRMPKRTAGR